VSGGGNTRVDFLGLRIPAIFNATTGGGRGNKACEVEHESLGMGWKAAELAMVGRSWSDTGHRSRIDRIFPRLGRFADLLKSWQLRRAGQRQHG
jgi:hypothetical protein